MQSLSLTVIALISLTKSLVAAFNVGTDSCTPVSGTFKFTSPNYMKCTGERLGDILRFTCGERGQIHFNFVDNTVHITTRGTYQNGEFSFHGACNEFGKQISHIGMYNPLIANTDFDKTFPGMTKKCNADGRGISVAFYSYTLTPEQLVQCSYHPVNPLPDLAET